MAKPKNDKPLSTSRGRPSKQKCRGQGRPSVTLSPAAEAVIQRFVESPDPPPKQRVLDELQMIGCTMDMRTFNRHVDKSLWFS